MGKIQQKNTNQTQKSAVTGCFLGADLSWLRNNMSCVSECHIRMCFFLLLQHLKTERKRNGKHLSVLIFFFFSCQINMEYIVKEWITFCWHFSLERLNTECATAWICAAAQRSYSTIVKVRTVVTFTSCFRGMWCNTAFVALQAMILWGMEDPEHSFWYPTIHNGNAGAWRQHFIMNFSLAELSGTNITKRIFKVMRECRREYLPSALVRPHLEG